MDKPLPDWLTSKSDNYVQVVRPAVDSPLPRLLRVAGWVQVAGGVMLLLAALDDGWWALSWGVAAIAGSLWWFAGAMLLGLLQRIADAVEKSDEK